jgi:hypothetical protein
MFDFSEIENDILIRVPDIVYLNTLASVLSNIFILEVLSFLLLRIMM